MFSQWNQHGLRGSKQTKNSLLYQGGELSSVTLIPSTKEGSKVETDYLMDPSNFDTPGPSLDVEYTKYIGVSGVPLDNNVLRPQRQITLACGILACTSLSKDSKDPKDPPKWRGDEQGDPRQCLLEEDDQGHYYPDLLNSDTMSLAFYIYLAIDLWLNGLFSVYRDDHAKDQKTLDLTVILAEIEIVGVHLASLPRSVIHVCCNIPFYRSPYRERKGIVGYVVAEFFRAPKNMSLSAGWNRQIQHTLIQESYPWYLSLPIRNTASRSSDQDRWSVAPAAIADVNPSSPTPKSAETSNTDTDVEFSSESRVSDTEEDDDTDFLNDEVQSFGQEPAEDHSGTSPQTESIIADASNNNWSSSPRADFESKDHGPPGPDPANCDPAAHPKPAGTSKPKPKATKPKPKATKPRPTWATKIRRTRTTNPLGGGTTHPAKLAKPRHRCTYSKCTLDFSTKYNLEVHEKRHIGKTFTCEECETKCASWNILTRHYNRQHQGYSWVCDLCGDARSRKPSPKDLERLTPCTAKGSGGVHDYQLFPGPLALPSNP